MFSGLDDPTRWVLPEVLREMAQRQPQSPWIIGTDGDSMSFGEADRSVAQAASYLASLGVERGERVGVFLFNHCDFIRAWLGLGRLGAVAVLLNTELRGAFLRHQLNNSEVACLVVQAELLPVVLELLPELKHLQRVIVVGDGVPALPPALQVNQWSEYPSCAPWEGDPPSASDIACIMYTSGTSGPSKGVLMPHAHCALYGIGAIECVQLQASDRYYITLPLFHANGLLMQLAATLLAGIPAILRPRFSATAWLSDVRQHGATVTNFLGTTAAFVLAQPPSPHDREHALRAVMPAPNLPQHEEAFRQRFGVRDVISGFGMTEVNIPVWGRLGVSAPGAAGWVHGQHFEVCIADPETDQALAPGQMGEILVRPKVPFGFMAGYLNMPDKTVEAWRNLWFHTGDAGIMDESGLLTFVDRIKDCIRRRGENISATEVEAVVQQFPGVAEVAAYAVPSDIPGAEDEVMLAVVPQPGQPLACEELVRVSAAQLPRFAKPRFVRIMAELPKTATGKVQRAVLRKQGTSDALDLG